VPKKRPKPKPYDWRDYVHTYDAPKPDLRSKIPTLTSATTPRRRPLSRDEELELAVDVLIGREPAFKQSARKTGLSRTGKFVLGRKASQPGFNRSDPGEYLDLAAMLPFGRPLVAARAGGRLGGALQGARTASKKVRVPRPPRERGPWWNPPAQYARRAAAAETIVNERDGIYSIARIGTGQGTPEDYRRAGLFVAQAGGIGAVLRTFARTPPSVRKIADPYFVYGLREISEFNND
jgi:hypothetical protein